MKLKYLLVLIVFLCLQSAASSVIRVKAVGLASPEITPGTRARAPALRAAKIMGYKKLALAAGIDIKGEALLKGARVVKTTFISDYKVQVVMEIHLPLAVEKRYRLVGVLDHNKYLDEPAFIVNKIVESMGNRKNVTMIRLGADEPTPTGIAGFVFDTVFNTNSSFSDLLLEKVGCNLVDLLHIGGIHKNTRILNKKTTNVCIETRYNYFGKEYSLIWEVKYHPHTIIADLKFIHDSHSPPTAETISKAKEAAITSIKTSYKKIFN